MITLRILLSPGRRGRVVDASGRSIPQPVPAPVIGSTEPLRIMLLDPSTLDPSDPYGFDTGAPLRLTISGDWDPATIPVYATNDLVRTSAGVYDLEDPSGTRTAEALALLGVLAERLCAWELTAYGGDPATEADWAHPLSVVQFDAPLRQRADSLGGDPAEAPSVDLRGPPGPPGRDADPSDADPAMDGTASAGSSDKCSRGDHVHPSDTSRVAKAGDTMTGSLTVSGEESSVEVAPGYFRITAGSNVTTYRRDRIQKKTGALLREIRLPDNGGVVALQQAIAPEFSTGSTYAVGAYCTHDGLLYRCASAVSTAGDWNASDWTAVCIVDEMGRSTPLPFDAECEHVTVPAGAYIDPDVLFYDASLGVEATFRIPSSPTPGEGSFRCGTWATSGSDSYQFYINSSDKAKVLRYSTSPTEISNAPFVGAFGTATISGNAFSNGTNTGTVSSTSSVGKPLNFLVCALSNTNNVPGNTCVNPVDIAAFKFSFSGVPFRDLIPVRIGTVGYLYDKASGRLFGSAVPSIPLTCGPDKATPTITLRWR